MQFTEQQGWGCRPVSATLSQQAAVYSVKYDIRPVELAFSAWLFLLKSFLVGEKDCPWA